MHPQLLFLAVFDGLAYAALLFLVAVGLSLVFGVLRILNVAHGSFFAIGAYLAASGGIAIASMGLSPWLAYPAMALAAALVGIVLGGALERLLLARIYGREDVLQLLVTFAAFMILEDVQRLVWGTQPYFQAGPLELLGNVELFGVFYTRYQILLLPAVALAVLVALRLFLRRTLAGRLVLCVAEDREAATSVGVDANRICLLTFVIGTSLAALAGALASATTSVVPGMGAEMIVLSFAVAATAGLGRIEGAAATAVLIGLGRSAAVYVFPELEVLVPYLVMTAVLLVRPDGLFGRRESRRI